VPRSGIGLNELLGVTDARNGQATTPFPKNRSRTNRARPAHQLHGEKWKTHAALPPMTPSRSHA